MVKTAINPIISFPNRAAIQISVTAMFVSVSVPF